MIEDVSPKWGNTVITLDSQHQSVQGRMLSLACSSDGQRVYSGTYSGVWRSDDGGQTFRQMIRPQPAPGQFDVPGALGGWEVYDLAVSPADQDVLVAVTRYDLRKTPLHGIYRSSDGGESWTLVHQFPGLPTSAGQIVWAADDGNLVIAAWGTSVAFSHNAGVNFSDVFPWGSGNGQAFHVAMSPSVSGARVVYALGNSQLWSSRNDGVDWLPFPKPVPVAAGGPTGEARGNAPNVMVIAPQQAGRTYVIADDGSLWFQDMGMAAPDWVSLPIPELGDDPDSGNRFLAIGGSLDIPLLFYCNQRRLYVALAPPQSVNDWRVLDEEQRVHLDLHGVFLSPDFEATIGSNGYNTTAGKVWLLSDGGIHRSMDGGKSFAASSGLSTLATVNIGGLAIPGKTALCLNCGDNGGFYSSNGGQSWKTITYDGGDNDTSFADPLQWDRMLVFTPRSGDNGSVRVYVGLPPDGSVDAAASYSVGGPPKPTPRDEFSGTGTTNWNAVSNHVMRGFRPVVHSLLGESYPDAGDYIFVRYKTDSTAVLLRTKASDQIEDGNEFDTDAISEQGGGNVYQVGPPLPSNEIDVVQASGGHEATVFYAGGDSLMRLWKWTRGMAQWQLLLPGSAGTSLALRFFVDPYRPNIVFIIDKSNISRSDDGGISWTADMNLQQQLTNNGDLPVDLNTGGTYFYDTVLNDMKFDPEDAARRYAVGAAGAFFTMDGVNWNRLLDATAFPGRPGCCYYDFVSDPCRRALYVGLSPRGVVKVSPLPWGSLQAPDPDTWTTNEKIAGKKSGSRPAVTVFQNMLFMVRMADSSHGMLWCTSSDGVNWSDDQAIPNQKTHTAVGLAEYNGALHMIHLGDSDNQLWWSRFDGATWIDSSGNEGDEKLGTQHSEGTPALAVYNGILHMVHMDNSSHEIWWSMYDGTSWKDSHGNVGDQKIKSQLSQSPPSLAVFGGKLHMLHIGDDSNNLWWSAYDGDVWWSNRRIRCQLSQQTPALAAQGGLLHMVHMGDSENTLWWSIYDGSEWTPDMRIPSQLSQAAPALSPTPDGSQLLMVHLGDSEQDLWSSLI